MTTTATRAPEQNQPSPDRGRGRERIELPAALILAVAAGITTWSAMLSWNGFTTRPSEFLVPLAWIIVVTGGLGALLRSRRAPWPLVMLTQVVVGLALASWNLTGSPLPGPALRETLTRAVEASNTFAAPVPADGGTSIAALLLLGGLAAYLLVELLACNLRRVPLAGLPLLTIYSVPVSLLDGALSWWVFAATAGGFLAMLYLQEQSHFGRWGRALDEQRPAVVQAPRSAVRGTALAIGLSATAAALVVPLAIPTLNLSVFDLGNGPGGDNDITIDNPTADLRRNLTRDSDLDLLTVRTDDPSPDHLRISVLNRFSDNTWSSGDRSVPTGNVPDGAMPPLEGVSAEVPRQTYDYEVSVTDSFASRWLPTQAPISAIEADDTWRYDSSTMDFIAGQDDLTTAGMSYAMTAVDLDIDAQELNTAPESYANIDDELREVPQDLPAIVTDLAESVTQDFTTPYEKAAALQQWFRRDGGFRYSLESVPQEVGVDELESFLSAPEDGGRVGYCQQFAASMAVMARVLGIPARVAVGFLEPEQVDEDTYTYSAFDLHAWPELYFPGAGWVLFDPTPAARVSSVPAYTRGLDTEVDNPADQPSDSASPSPSGPVSQAAPSARPEEIPDQTADSRDVSDGGVPWWRIVALLVVLALLTAGARLPRAWRERQRVDRLGRGAEGAWQELRATMVDLGLPWPTSRTPRHTQAVLVDHFAAPADEAGAAPERPRRGPGQHPAAEEALEQITDAVERDRYSRTASAADAALASDVLLCREALLTGVSPRARRRATWLPASVVGQRRISDAATGGEPAPVATGSVDRL